MTNVMNLVRGVLFASIFMCTACTMNKGPSDAEIQEWAKNYEPVEEPTRTWALQIADKEAQKVLDEYNAGPPVEIANYGGPFHLDQYTRDVVRIVKHEHDMDIIVAYNLAPEVPVGFLGHPAHFSVMICEQTAKTQVFGGR